MSDPASKGLDAVVNDDGSLVVSADQAAQLNLKPGDHLRLVPRQPTSFGEILDGIAEDQRLAGVTQISDEEAAEWADDLVKQVRQDRRHGVT